MQRIEKLQKTEKTQNSEKRRLLKKILFSSFLWLIAKVLEETLPLPLWGRLCLYLPAYLLSGWDVIWEAVQGVREGEVLDENFLMSVATLGALLIGFLPYGRPSFGEAVFVMLFYKVGEYLEVLARTKSEASIADLMKLRPDQVQVEREGKAETIAPACAKVGEIMVLKNGERAALDGVVEEGTSHLNTAALTGESRPLSVRKGDEVLSGMVNTENVLRVRVTKPYEESTLKRILDVLQNAQEKKSRQERFITRFARIYTPIVVGLSLCLSLVPPLAGGDFGALFPVWLFRALTFLVVSCPCALVISVPLAFFAAIGGAAGVGILFRSAADVDTLARVQTVVFDKTGTLTRGEFTVTEIKAIPPFTKEEVLSMAAHAERFSTHPVALALRQALAENALDAPDLSEMSVTDVKERAGKGICACVGGKQVCVGNRLLMEEMGVPLTQEEADGVAVSIDGRLSGMIFLGDSLRKEAKEALQALRKKGVKKLFLLTGDAQTPARQVAQTLHLDAFYASLLPDQKVEHMRRIRAQANGPLLFVGDGINDAPVLALSSVGMAMGGMGSDAAVEAADVVLMQDQLTKVAQALSIAQKAHRLSGQNIAFALLVKLFILLLTALGLSSMALAVFADVGVTFLCILNALRALRVS